MSEQHTLESFDQMIREESREITALCRKLDQCKVTLPNQAIILASIAEEIEQKSITLRQNIQTALEQILEK